MGISLELYRTAIGLFGGGKGEGRSFLLPKQMFYTKFNDNFMHRRKQWSAFLYTSYNGKFKAKVLLNSYLAFSILLQLLLVQCGDVERNPGPVDNNKQDVTVCHANIRSLKHKDLETGLLDRFLHIKCYLAGTFDIITLSKT